MLTVSRFSAIPAIAALVLSVSGSFAVAQNTWNVVTQYQYVAGTSDSNLTSDWFAGVNGYYRTGTAGTVTAPGTVYTGTGSSTGNSGNAAPFQTSTYSNTATIGSIYNYTSISPISNSTPLAGGTANPFGTGAAPTQTAAGLPAANRYVAGPGLNYIAQNNGNEIPLNGGNFRIRNQNAEFNIEGSSANTSTGITFLGWSTATPTTLSSGSYVFSLSLGTSGQSPTAYNPGFQAAIQDTTGQWWLSAWATGTYSGTPALPYTLDMNTGAFSNGWSGTASPFAMTGTAQGWYPYTPADLTSTSLAIATNSGNLTPGWQQYFTGTAQAFGVYFGQAAVNEAFRMRGFEVISAVPEPATVGMTALGLGGVAALGIVRRMRRRS